ncbi:hypothetical protein [Persephonella sp.]
MAEHNFTKNFKENLCEALNEFFEEENLDLIAVKEFKIESKKYSKSFIDIAVLDRNFEEDGTLQNILGIEIEVSSNQEQIIKNYDKFRYFITQKNKGKGKFIGGLFHLIFDYANISEDTTIALIKHAIKESERRYFFYNMYLHDVEDLRASRQLAYELVENDWKFRAKFIALLDLIFFE